MFLQMRPSCLLGVLSLSPGTWTFRTLTTMPPPFLCTLARPLTLFDALSLCSDAFFDNFGYLSIFLLEKPRHWWMPLDLVLAYFTWPCGTRTRAMFNVSMSTALQPFVFAVPTSILGSIVSVQANMSQEVLARTSGDMLCFGCYSCSCPFCSEH